MIRYFIKLFKNIKVRIDADSCMFLSEEQLRLESTERLLYVEVI